jgi:hypothetical protein
MVEYAFSPSVTRAEFGRIRKGTYASVADVTVRIGTDVPEAEGFVSEEGSTSRSRAFVLKRNAVLPEDLAVLDKTFASKARAGTSKRAAVLDQEDGASHTTIAGYYDRRDTRSNAILKKINDKQKPLDMGSTVCRVTSFTRNTPRNWKKSIAAFERAAELHRAMDPERYATQLAFVDEDVLPCYRIGTTAYTTVSANWNFRTKIHVDDGDFDRGGGLLVIAGCGYEGGELCFPRLGVAVELFPGDALAMDVFEWHGNLPIRTTAPEGYRLSLVLYARHNMSKCKKILDPHNLVGVEWAPTPHALRFEKTLDKVAECARKMGRVPPVGTRYAGLNVGEWCHNRRTDHRAGELSPEQVLAIERAIPCWTWENDSTSMDAAHAATRRRNAARFDLCARLVAEFSFAHGRLPKSGELVQNMDLGKWIDNRKQDARKGRLSSEQADALQSVLRTEPVKTCPDYEIAVHSYKRPETLRDKTAKLLELYGIPAARVTVFVADDSELETYEAALRDSPYRGRIMIGDPGLRLLNYIHQYYPEGTRLVCMDDDFVDLYRLKEGGLVRVDDLEQVIRDGFRLCLAHGASLWGVYPAKNAFFMRREPRVGLVYIAGAFWGGINSRDLPITLDDLEDYERTLLHYERDGKVCRIDYVTFEKMTEQHAKNQERVLESARDLVARFPHLCSMYIRSTTGLAEVRLIS